MLRSIRLLTFCLIAVACDKAPLAPQAPGTPINVSAVALAGDIRVSWSPASSDPTTYDVQVSVDDSVWTFLESATPPNTTVWHRQVVYWVTYHYRVRACNAQGCSSWVETSATSKGGTTPQAKVTRFTPHGTSAGTLTIQVTTGLAPTEVTVFFGPAGSDVVKTGVRIYGGTVLPGTATLSDADSEPPQIRTFELFGLQSQAKYDAIVLVTNQLGSVYSAAFSFSAL